MEQKVNKVLIHEIIHLMSLLSFFKASATAIGGVLLWGDPYF
jgi:hypothetical protein